MITAIANFDLSDNAQLVDGVRGIIKAESQIATLTRSCTSVNAKTASTREDLKILAKQLIEQARTLIHNPTSQEAREIVKTTVTSMSTLCTKLLGILSEIQQHL